MTGMCSIHSEWHTGPVKVTIFLAPGLGAFRRLRVGTRLWESRRLAMDLRPKLKRALTDGLQRGLGSAVGQDLPRILARTARRRWRALVIEDRR